MDEIEKTHLCVHCNSEMKELWFNATDTWSHDVIAHPVHEPWNKYRVYVCPKCGNLQAYPIPLDELMNS